MTGGWIKLYRQMLNWEWYSDINTFRLFIHLLLTANYESKVWRGITIKKGQKVTSFGHLANETGLSVQQVRTAVEKLKSTHEITSKSTSRYTLITIVKWHEYQAEQQANQQTDNKQITTTKEIKNKKNNIGDSDLEKKFDEFFSKYPRQIEELSAKKEFLTLLEKEPSIFPTILEGVEGYSRDIVTKGTQERFIKFPKNWLSERCWEKEYKQPSDTKEYKQPELDCVIPGLEGGAN